jgi:hypothetical protein
VTAAQLILAPVLIHVVLIYYVGIRAAVSRAVAVRGREVRIKDIALDNRGWPDAIRKLGNNYDNQFQVPMMWYALVALLLATGLVDSTAIVLAWLFLATRIVHTYIHIGSNIVPRRLYAFLTGVSVLFLMWLWFALRLYVVG